MEQSKMQIRYGDPLDLIPYSNNPRVNDYAVKKVLESIKEFGFKNPILVDENMEIIAGHTRREASILLGLQEVPYIIATDLTPEQIKAYRLADNKLSELAVWDTELLREELFTLQEADFSLEVMGFTEFDLTSLFNDEIEPEPEIEDITPKEEKTTLPMLRFGSNSVRITPDELTTLSNRYNEYIEENPEKGFVYWLLNL